MKQIFTSLCHIAVRVFLVFFSLALMLVLAEVVMRYWLKEGSIPFWRWINDSSLYRLDKGFIYTLNPSDSDNQESDIWINSWGFRSQSKGSVDAFEQAKIRVFVVGDSFVWGNTLTSETYPALLEKILQSTSSSTLRDTQVMNAGISGYGIDQQYKLIKEKIIPQYHPTHIVWNINVNDFPDNQARPLYVLDEFQKLRQIGGWRSGVYLQGVFTHFVSWIPYFHESVFLRYISSRLERVKLHPVTTNEDELWRRIQLEMKEIDDLTTKEGVELLFALSPSQRYIQQLQGWEQDHSFFNQMKRYLPVDRTIDQNIAFIDYPIPQELFLDESPIFIRGTWHPSALGNKVMAESILPFFESSNSVLGDHPVPHH